MKHCPNCYATYEDDSQTYCTNEGTRLAAGPPRLQPQPTIISPSQGRGDLTASSEFFKSGGSASSWSGSSPSLGGQPKPWSQPTIEATATAPRRSSPLLMILLGLVMIVVGLLAGLFLANRNGATASEAAAGQRAPDVKPEALLAELKEAEGKITEANIKGDKTTLDRLLADDYIAIAADGKSYNKAQTLASMEPADTVASWSIDGAKLLSYGRDTATLTGIITFKTRDMVERQQFTDSFVKRDGRWQAFASQSTVLKNY